jgi:GAF domain-containing protein
MQHVPTSESLQAQARALLTDDWLSNLANLSSLIYHQIPDLNWAGFYLHRQGQLSLGPFQGRVACLWIPLGKGVCGAAALERRTLIVPDVHAFPGHIACDERSRSELVIPLIKGGKVLGLDSPSLARFDQDLAQELEAVVEILVEKTHWPCEIGAEK